MKALKLNPGNNIEAILKHPDYIACMILGDINVKVYFIYYGGSMISYYFYYNDSLLFCGDDYKPSPLIGIESIDSFIDLFGFLTTAPGDTDIEYFKDYTPDQFAWCASNDCQNLKLSCSDYEEHNGKFLVNTSAINYFKDAYNYGA